MFPRFKQDSKSFALMGRRVLCKSLNPIAIGILNGLRKKKKQVAMADGYRPPFFLYQTTV
jgi:hypothetical protein